MSWLTDRLEELTAQAVPFDKRTAATVRAARNPVRPAQTVRSGGLAVAPPKPVRQVQVATPRPTPQVQVQQPRPQPRVQVEAPRMTQPIRVGDAEIFQSPTLTNKPMPVTQPRSLSNKLYDQLNILDNNRTFKQATPTQSKSAGQQLGQFGAQTARGVVGGTARFVNTAAAQVPQAIGTARMQLASRTNNPEAFRNATEFTERANDRFRRGDGGILDAGTLYSADEARRGDIRTGLTRVGGGTVEAGLELASGAVTGVVGKQIAKQGFKRGLTTQLPNIAKNAALNTAQGGVMAANQGADFRDVLKSAALNATVGTAADLGLGFAGAGVAKGAPVVTTKLVDLNSKIEQAALPKPYRLSLEDRRALSDYTDYLAGNSKYNPRPSEISRLTQQVRDIGQKTGIDVVSGSPRDRYLRIGDFLENFDAQKQSMLQGGYARLPGGGERSVFDQNPMLPENQPILKGKDAGKEPEKLPEFDTKKVKIRDKVFRSTRSIIERQGRSGKELAGMLQKSRDTYELSLADIQKRIPTLRKLKDKEFENFVEATQGLAEPSSDKIAKAVQEWRTVHPGIRDRAVAAGLDVGDLGETYYPHIIDYDKVFKDKNTFNAAINHLVQTNQAPTPEDAIKLLNYARDISRNREFGNLESSRVVDLPMYDKTPNSLMSYLSGANKRIAQTETFGQKDETALELIKRIGLEGGDTEAAKNAFDVAVGAKKYNPTTEKASRIARQYITTTRLGLGAITNVSQSVNTGIVTGHLRTLKSMFKQIPLFRNPKTKAFIEDTGVIADAVLNDLRTHQGDTFSSKVFGKTLKKITAPGFNAVEKFNRSVAATAGRDYALRLAQKGDEKTLRKLGVTGKIEGTLTEKQQIQAARKVVEKTQFKVDAQDLPGWADTPGGKLVAQFRSFSYNQSKFFSNEIIKPAAKGNFKPLARLLAAIPVGYALAETKRAINARPTEENELRKGVEAFSNVGGAGLAVDIFRNMVPLNNKYLPPDRRVSMAASTVGGPTAGLGIEAVGAVSEAIQKKKVPEDGVKSNKLPVYLGEESYLDPTQLARFGMRQIPIVGSRLQNSTLPYKERENAESPADSFKQGVGTFLGALSKPFTGTAGAEAKEKPKDVKKAVAEANKKSKERSKDFKSRFSKDDYELYKLNDAERKSLVKDGVVPQSKFDNLDKYAQKVQKEIGLSKGTKNTVKLKDNKRGTELLDKLGSFTKGEREKWESGKFDESFKDVYDTASGIRPDSLPELPKNNRVLDAYASYLKVKAKNPSELKLNDAKKDFLTEAYRSELDEGARELFRTYPVSEKIDAIDKGSISRESLQAAVKVDDFFLSNGLATSPKISNDIREAFGLSDAPKRGRSGRRSGGKKGDRKKTFDYTKPLFSSASSSSVSRSLRSILNDALKA